MGSAQELSEEAIRQIIAALGNDDGLALVDTRFALMVYSPENLDRMPRPADYVAEFSKVKQDAFALMGRLRGMSEFYIAQFVTHGADYHAIERALAQLTGVAGDIVAEMQGKSSKGAPSNFALLETIRHLHDAFERHYKGPVTARRQQGAFILPVEQDTRELEYLKAALLGSRILKPNTDDRAISDYRRKALQPTTLPDE
jgi:hypothetical protein